MDVSIKRGLAVMVFYLVPGIILPSIIAKLIVDRIQPVLFMSKLLSAVEKRYYSTELEITGLV
jgi:hypothetical protein